MNRRHIRGILLVLFLVVSGVCFYDGYANQRGSSYILGGCLAGFALLGIFGVNIWYRGPLDMRDDPDRPDSLHGTAEANWGNWAFIKVGNLGTELGVVFAQASILLAAGMLGVGIVDLLRIPTVAFKNGVLPQQVALLCLDNHEAEPLYLIEGYQERIKNAGMKWENPREIAKFETQKSQGGFIHTAYLYSGQVLGRQETTTPHTRLSADQIAEARRGLEAVYDSKDPRVWKEVLDFGETQFLRWWKEILGRESLAEGEPLPFVLPWRGTEEEKIWFAWQRLSAGGNEGELSGLAEQLSRAYPNPADAEAARAWARLYVERREEYFRALLKKMGIDQPGKTWNGFRTLPPINEFTLAWILDRHVGLKEQSRETAEKRWLRYFSNHEEPARQWGLEIERERRQTGDPLPPGHPNVPLVCALERLTNWDSQGVKNRQAAMQVSLADRQISQAILTFTYPSDEIFKILAEGDPLNLVTLPGWYADRSSPGVYFIWMLGWFLLLAVIALLVRLIVLDTLGARILGMVHHEKFRSYYDTQTLKPFQGLFLSLLLVPLAKWAWELWKLSPPHSFLFPTPFHLLPAIFMSIVAGGLLIHTINRLVAVVLLRLGADIEKIWLDEIIGTTLGVALLWYFGNSPSSLIAFAAAAILPQVYKRWKMLRPGYQQEMLPRQPILFEAHPVGSYLGIAIPFIGAAVYWASFYF